MAHFCLLRSSQRQFGSTTDFVSYLVGFLIHLSPYFQHCLRFPICRYRNHVFKILTVRDPRIVKNLKIFPNFWTLYATQKTTALYTALFLKNHENYLKIIKNAFSVKSSQFLAVVLDFLIMVLFKGLWFFALRSVSQNAQFKLSKTT